MAFFINQLSSVVAAIAAIILVHAVSEAAYNVFFHPLRSFPGPISHAASRIPYCYRLLRGSLSFDMLALHQKYGNVVRVAPNELAFSCPEAWKDIMSRQSGSSGELEKFQRFYKVSEHAPTSILSADREEHVVLRRQLSYGFSEKSMKAQEPLITQYIDLLIQRLREKTNSDPKAPIDIGAWYNYTTFDIIGDLAFGKPFGSLQNSRCHPFVELLLGLAQAGAFILCLSFFPILKSILFLLIPKSLMKRFEEHRELSFEKLRERMQNQHERHDLIEGLLLKKEELGLDMDKLEANSSLLLIAGSETTATLLAGVTYLLATNQQALARLTEEIRTTFVNEDEIHMSSVNKLVYMTACLNEALRLYPPVPAGMPRVVPKGGCRIAGHYVPGDTIVAIHQWACYHNEKHFADPFGFHPERFLGDARYAGDKFDILQPFHIGPRNCIGKNLAYAEMRIILARVIYNFDLRIANDSLDWMKQRVFFLWEKPPLNVYLTPAQQ